MTLISLVTGGTGGHVFPAVALVEHLSERLNEKGVQLEIITDPRGARFMKNLKDVKTHIWPISRKPKWVYPLSLARHGAYALTHFLRKRPKAVVGFGGYPSLMPLATAQWLGIPTFINEQNRHLGKANRWLAKRAHRVWLSHPSESPINRSHVVGSLVRKNFCDVPPWLTPEGGSPLRILIVGGSQGASILGANVASLLCQASLSLEVVHQCRDTTTVESLYRESRIPHYVTPFIEDMAARYAWAHLVISRAGASTVGELMATKRPAIFVPFAAAIEGDQRYNAAHASSWSWTITEANLTDQLMPLIQSIGNDPTILASKVATIPTSTHDLETIYHDLMSVV